VFELFLLHKDAPKNGKLTAEFNFFSPMYIKMGIQMFVCSSVGMWRANRNPNPCPNLYEILHPHPHLSKEGFGALLTPGPSPA